MAKRRGSSRKSSSRSSSAKRKGSRPKKVSRKPARKPSKAKPRKVASKAAKARGPRGAAAKGPKATAPAKPAPSSGGKPNRKGITIVSPKPQKRPREKPAATVIPTFGPSLLGPGGPKRKPLISSGPNAAPPGGLDVQHGKRGHGRKLTKSQVDKFRAILIRKRAELAGDVNRMESEALMGSSGSLSHLPQHMAEQGSDAYGQSLALDLAAADRRLIKEIDDALGRIEAGTYGICELTKRQISAERLDELPWARYSIEAARELERRSRTR